MYKSLNNEKGITLISLIITIVVLIILSSVVLFSQTGDGGIKSVVENEKNLINQTDAKQSVEITIERLKLENIDNIESFVEKLKEELRKEDYYADVTISESDSNMYVVTFKDVDYNYYFQTEQTRTMTGRMPTYYNPIIPKGFDILETEDASWEVVEDEKLGKIVKGWNDGLVIQDRYGNEFVWVPVDGVNVKYEKMFVKLDGGIEDSSQISDDTLPQGITSEQYQIDKYHGFYIGRYEAGLPETMTEAMKDFKNRNVEGIPVSKKNQVPWNEITYNTAKINAQNMYNTNYVQSGLLTGKMWDTTIKWIENSKENVKSDSKSWGNCYDSTVEGVTFYSTDCGTSFTKTDISKKSTNVKWLLKTGNTDYTKRKNIYDLVGNVWEWTNEKYSTNNAISRGGDYYSNESFTVAIAAFRLKYSLTSASGCGNLGYRVALYVK